MVWPRLLPALPLALCAATAQGQVVIRAPNGTFTGSVQDSATGQPIGYALVIVPEQNQRVFAGASGRFALSGMRAGRATLRVQQIGYRALTLAVEFITEPGNSSGTGLTIPLVRQAVVLPEIVVQGDVCTGAAALGTSESGTLIDEAFKNAERLFSLQEAYPARGAFQRVTTILNATYERTTGWVDTVAYDTRTQIGYQRGKVLQSRGRNGREYANYFTTSDIAREEFRETHCFWYAGIDSLDGFTAYRVDFAPKAGVKTADWAGSLMLDSTSMRLLRSDARLVNLPKRGTSFGSAQCTVLYHESVPTLVQEFQARCIIAQLTQPVSYVVERWRLIDHSFIGKRPDVP